MIITTTKNAFWQEGKETQKTGTTIDFCNEKQTIRGFGCCFSELSALALNELSATDKTAVLNELFGENGCNFNYCRTPIGASDFATDFYSYNEVDGDYEMVHFSIDRDKKLLLPLILEGVARQKDMQIFASPWCPPLWLKTEHQYCNGVFHKTEENYRAYALYFKKYVQSYKNAGVPLVHIHPQNEPCSNQIFPSCVWKGNELTEFIGSYLGPALEGEGVDIFFGTINGPETDGRYLWTQYNEYLGFAMQDENAKKYIKGVGYQWAGKYALAQTQDDYPNLEIIQTESECGDGQNSWEQMLYVFSLMRHYFRFGASAYVYWNLALKKNQPSSWGWLQNSLVSVENGKMQFTPEFYMMKHFAHFVKRGAKYIATKGELSSLCCLFKNPNGQIVVLAYNPYDVEKTITIQGKSYILPPKSINTIC